MSHVSHCETCNCLCVILNQPSRAQHGQLLVWIILCGLQKLRFTKKSQLKVGCSPLPRLRVNPSFERFSQSKTLIFAEPVVLGHIRNANEDEILWYLQHVMANQVVPKHQGDSALVDAGVAQYHQCSYSLLRERTIRTPLRAQYCGSGCGTAVLHSLPRLQVLVCITSIAPGMACVWERMRVEDEEDLEDLEVLFVEYRALDIIEGAVVPPI